MAANNVALASLSPDLRAAIIRAYRAWKRTAQQLSLFDEDYTERVNAERAAFGLSPIAPEPAPEAAGPDDIDKMNATGA